MSSRPTFRACGICLSVHLFFLCRTFYRHIPVIFPMRFLYRKLFCNSRLYSFSLLFPRLKSRRQPHSACPTLCLFFFLLSRRTFQLFFFCLVLNCRLVFLPA